MITSGRRLTRATGALAPLIMLIMGWAPASAQAADLRMFRLPAETLDAALVRFAVQGAVSVGGFPVAGCEGHSRPTLGLMRPQAALRALLPAGCDFEMLDARSFRITAHAQPARRAEPTPAASQPTVTVEEIVVTAEKRAEPLTGSAYAVSALSGREIGRLGGKSFADAALQIAGVTVTNLGSGRNKIFVRGLSDGSFTGQTQSTVGLYLDDVPITYSAPDPDLRLVDIDHIEVLRGPQGSLYGSGSIGGIVRIVTNRPDPVGFSAAATIEGALAEHGEASRGIDATLNLPVRAVDGAIRLSLYRDHRGGYIDNARLGLSDINGSRRSGLRLAAEAPLPASWRLTASFATQSIVNHDAQYTEGGRPLVTQTAVREPHDNDFAQFSATALHEGQDVRLKVSAAFIDHTLTTRYDATGALGATGPAAFDEARVVDLTVAEATATSIRPGRLHWLGGLFVSQADETGSGRLTSLPGGAARSVYRRHDRLTEAAAYGEAAFDVTPHLTLTAGGRLFESRLAFRASGFDLAATPLAPARGHAKVAGFAPKLRVSYTVFPDAVVYAQLQEGYRAGGFNVPAAASGDPASPSAISAFRPDRLRSYELGATWPLLANTVSLRAALFRANWSRLQTDQYLASGLPQTVNIGDGVNTGVETEVVWRPDDHWQLRGNLLVEDPEITRVSNAFPASVDIGLPGVPSVLASADIRYRWPVGARLTAEVSGQYAYVGRSYLTFDGAAASAMGDYGVGRIAATLEGEGWRAQAFVDNLADARGNTFAFGDPFSRERARQATPLRPRTAGLSLTRSF